MKKTAEYKVSEAINQLPSTIIIDGKEYQIAPPTYGTLLMVSAILSKHSQSIEFTDNTSISDILDSIESHSYAPEVLAVLVLGSKRIKENRACLLYKWLKWIKIEHKTELEKLTEIFSDDTRILEVVTNVITILKERMDLGFFVQAGIFLKGAIMTAPTKEINPTAPTL